MKKLQAGPLTAQYENGFIRWISCGGNEVLRMIYFALRDHNWNTMALDIENEEVNVGARSFDIRYNCGHMDGGVSVVEWKAHLWGDEQGEITFEINGVVQEEFRKNRAGFCVLHPLQVAGENCEITGADGSRTIETFPNHVRPDNPFRNIAAMRWKSAGAHYRLTFEGDLFETEDQRNWGDASFKTFCTPLDRPFPATLKVGQKIFQRITFTAESPAGSPAGSESHVTLRRSGVPAKVPALGVGASTEVKTLSLHAISLLRAMRLGHCRVDLYPGDEHWVSDFSAAYEQCFSLGLPVEAVLHLSDNFEYETEAFSVLCRQHNVRLRKVLLLSRNGLVTRQEVIHQGRALKASLQGVAIGAGTNYNFNELNKNRFDAAGLDYVSFAMDPQEHASDDWTLLENMESPAHLVESARALYPGLQVHVSPLTLRKRFNPYATNPADLFIDETRKADPRQQQEFAARWTFGSLCALTRAGASSATYYQTAGQQGIMSANAEAYPVYDVLKTFAACQGKNADVLVSSDPLRVQGVLLDKNVLGLMNLSDFAVEVRMEPDAWSLGPREIRFFKSDSPQ